MRASAGHGLPVWQSHQALSSLGGLHAWPPALASIKASFVKGRGPRLGNFPNGEPGGQGVWFNSLDKSPCYHGRSMTSMGHRPPSGAWPPRHLMRWQRSADITLGARARARPALARLARRHHARKPPSSLASATMTRMTIEGRPHMPTSQPSGLLCCRLKPA